MKLIIDCGTTNLRVSAVNDMGQLIAQSKRPGGVRHTAIDGHNGRLKQMIREAIDEVLAACNASPADVTRCIAYGMITSNMGLLEIPHLVAPASVQNLHNGMQQAAFP